MIDLGTVKPGATIRIPFSSFDKDDGSSITMTNYAAADILIYKDGSTTERASTAGFTATTDFDSKTGKHLAIIDLADNTTADFYAAGSEYLVAIDAVTVDGVTVGGWIARFRIGYREAVLDTTIATLASQTSFTLTAGPAEDDALNGWIAVIHDAASAVQATWVVVLDYTGSTKTVTLAATPATTFTVAAKDNISFMYPAPLQPTTIGRTLDVAATGEAGLDFNNILSTSLITLHSLTVTGATTLTGAVSLGSTLGISGTVTLAAVNANTITTSGTATFNALTVTGSLTAGTNAIPWNAAWDAEVQSEVDDALVVHRLDELLNADSDIDGAAPPTVGSVFHELMTKTTGSFTFDQTTDSLEAIRDRGDAAWTGGGAAPTVSEIATAVWQDTTAGDFTVASSIGKSLYTTGNAPGAASGLLIAGSNAATTFANLTVSGTSALGAITGSTVTFSGAVAFQSTFAVTTSTSLGALSCTTLTASGAVAFQSTVTVTGATTITGNVALAAGLTITQSTTNGHGITVTGNGTGAGILTTGGATGPGFNIVGGGTSGHGILITATSGHGFFSTGGGTDKYGFYCVGSASGSSATGFRADGGATGGHGGAFFGSAAGSGWIATAGATGAAGLQGYGGSGNAHGILGKASALSTNSSGIYGWGWAGVAYGIWGKGNGDLGAGGYFESDGVSNAHGFHVEGSGTGEGVHIKAGATGTAGLRIEGGATSGPGILVTTTSGDGVSITATGTSKHGIIVTGGNGGTSDGLKLVAGTGGVGLRGDTITISGATTFTGSVTATNASNQISLGTDMITAGTLAADAIGTSELSSAAVLKIWTTALTEAYRATAATGTGAQLLYELLAGILDHSISGTTKTTRKIDGTTAKTYQLDSSTVPTSITELT